MKNYNKIDYYNLDFINSICHCIGIFPSYIDITAFNNCNISIITDETGNRFFEIITNNQPYIYSEAEVASFKTEGVYRLGRFDFYPRKGNARDYKTNEYLTQEDALDEILKGEIK